METQRGEKMLTSVSLVKVGANDSNLKTQVAKAIALISPVLPSKVDTLIIKPNLCYYWNASTGQTTDPQYVSVVIDHFREIYGDDIEIKIAEADASAMQTKYAFLILGYTKLAEQKKVKLFNLSEDAVEEREIQVNGSKIVLKVPKSLLQSELFINMPKLKIMRGTHISCAMKNLFGAIAYPRKVAYHPQLSETIVAINKLLKPNLNLVDGLVALGRFPVKLGIIIAGTNTFAVDWIAAQIMGYKPSRIKFLKEAIKENLGNPRDVHVVGERIEIFNKEFPTENNFNARLKMSLQLSLIKGYSRITGDIIPPSMDDA
jgi:uncharacterized protein (DUF362 family)